METKIKLRHRRKVNVDLEIKNYNKDISWGDVYAIGYVRFSLYQDDGVLHIMMKCLKRYPDVKEDGWFNSYQYFLFRRAMFGLEVYKSDELEYMHPGKKARIRHVNFRAKETIERFIQQVIIYMSNKLLVTKFPKSRITRWMLENHDAPVGRYDPLCKNDSGIVIESEPDYFCDLDPAFMGISKKTIAGLLVINHVLPDNFFDLEVKDDPRMKRLREPLQEPLDTL